MDIEEIDCWGIAGEGRRGGFFRGEGGGRREGEGEGLGGDGGGCGWWVVDG